MLKTLAEIAIGIGMFFGSLVGIHQEQAPVQATQTFGAFNPSGGGTYRLGQSVGTSDTTIKLSSFTEPVSGIKYTMTYLNASVGYGTVSPQSSISEFVSFTGVTQNNDGSATLTGVVRGLSRSPAGTASNCTVASTTLAQGHAGQSIFILSNSPCFQQEYAVKQNTEYITGSWGFQGTAPTSTICSSSTQLCNKNYVDSVALAGAATSTETNGGIVELGTLAEQATSFDGGSTKPTVLQTKNSTSTCQVVGTYNIVASSTTGRLDKGCFDQTANYALTGNNTISSTTVTNLQVANATTTGTLYIGTKLVPSPYFGGTGTDGALAISSGTTTLNTGGQSVYEKDYTSISITGTGALNFTGTTTASVKTGTTIILRSQGVCTFTSSAMTMIDLRWLGGGPSSGWVTLGTGSTVANGGGGSGTGQGGTGQSTVDNSGTGLISVGAPGGPASPSLSSSTRMVYPGGNNGGGASIANGGFGSGGLYIECAGAYNFTTGGFMGTGQAGVATGMGGGGGANILVFYASLTADSGTYSLTGGGGNTKGGAGADGTHLETKNTFFY